MSITYDKAILKVKAEQYCKSKDTGIAQELGFGTQGVVFKTLSDTAIKVYELNSGYKRERDAYIRLRDKNIRSIRGLTIPSYLDFNDSLYIIEMSVVHVPCLIDFGGAYLESPEHLLRDESWYAEKADEFGVNWDEAQAVIREFEHRSGICLADINTGNIKFC